jgi:anhydro-N-acetylmuramic acid kinase
MSHETLRHPPEWFVGLMTGTSFDGIDAALLKTDGEAQLEFGPSITIPHTPDRKRTLAKLMGQRSAPAAVVEELTDAHAQAVNALLQRSGLTNMDIRAAGFHGQTILHAPSERLTVQIGDGSRLAKAIAIDVIDQFRIADVMAGGEGAPLAPIFHQALLRQLPLPAAMVNIGGVANVTWTDGKHLLACDTGPGNAPLDDLMRSRCERDFDEGGEIAASGTVREELVARCLEHPYFARPAPKSLDRQELAFPGMEQLPLEDAAATLAAITADSIVAVRSQLPSPPLVWVITGGGRHNRAIMGRLRAKLDARVIAAEDAHWDGDGMEAYLFAYLAARRLRDLPASFPQTTGVPEPTVCGQICPA